MRPLSKGSSRASSTHSLHAPGFEEELPHNEPHIDSDFMSFSQFQQASNSSADQPSTDPDRHVLNCIQVTQNDALGSILLDITKCYQELAKKTNSKDSVLDINDLCVKYANGMRLQKQRIDNKLQLTTELVQTNLIHNELNSHRINQALEAPTRFSSVDVLTTPSKIADCSKLLPNRNNKFSGGKKDTDMSIVEFLNTMNNCQEKVNMSKKEFLDMLQASTTGAPYLQIQLFKANNESISQIYHSLMTMYDKRPSAEIAKEKLHKFKALKGSTLAEVESYVMSLANRIAMPLPIGESRTHVYNLEACQAMIRSMPPTSKTLVQNLYNQTTAKLGRTCTFSELSMALNVFRTSIDEDLAQNGHVDYKERHNKHKESRSPHKYSTHAVSSSYNFSKNKFQNKSVKRSDSEQETKDTFYVRDTRRDARKSASTYNNRKPGYNKSYSNFNGPKNNNRTQQCSLCGQTSHRSPNCRNMRDDTGNIINIIPTHGICSVCNSNTRKLHHPANLCPWRNPHGYMFKKQ